MKKFLIALLNICYLYGSAFGLKGHIGLSHQSFSDIDANDKKESYSRSWNQIYFESFFYMPSNVLIAPRLWYRIPESESEDDNPGLLDAIGYGHVVFLYPYKTNVFKLKLRNNLKPSNKGFMELDWTFPLPGSKSSFAYFQISNGYGDSLIDYDRHLSRMSLGISLSR